MFKRWQVRSRRFFSMLAISKARLLGAEIGPGTVIFSGAILYNCEFLKIGSNVFINDRFWCNAKGGVLIGSDVLIGPNVVVHSSNHNFRDPGLRIRDQGHTDLPVAIHDDVWLGANVIVLPGVTISSRIVVAAGAVVTSDLKEPGVYGGCPARLIKPL
jgi:maltose O-acetyltransferase